AQPSKHRSTRPVKIDFKWTEVRMRTLGIFGAAALFLFMMAAPAAYSQDNRDQDKPKAQEAPKPQDERAPKTDNRTQQDNRAQQNDRAQQDRAQQNDRAR